MWKKSLQIHYSKAVSFKSFDNQQFLPSLTTMGLLETYDYLMTEVADKRTNHWPLVGSPVPLLLLTIAYLYLVLRCGPRYMSDKRPYSLKTYIKCYNLFQVFANFLIVHQVIDGGVFTEIGMGCAPFKYTYEPNNYKMAQISWWTLCLKIVDYSETCVFVLRKKNRQISLLHLYHHISTAWLSWVQTKYYASGMALPPLTINSFVHVIMYSYYFLSSYGPGVQRYTNQFKPFFTIIQMVQFWILVFHGLQVLLPGCPTIDPAFYVWIMNLLVNFVLFLDFYRKSYVHKKKQ